ncbi:hypothetical protein HYD54_02925 [Mycoplasmopsis bovis]|nr:hypothetical protein [Mycoplasmopsis bovis]QQH71880.1 hypothetical protein HYD54_02925 [Mycoplasmopsis bovis]
MLDWLFWGFLENDLTGEILVADQGFRTKVITELLEQNREMLSIFCH